MIVTPGGQLALYAAVQGTLDRGDHAVVVAPYYATYPGTFRAAEADFTVVEAEAADGFQPRASAIEAALKPNTRAILINTPNNPTGAIYSRESLEAIAKLCVERDLWLLSDEVYWTLSGGASCLAARPARHGRADAGHQLHVEEPRHDRLAHRLADRAGKHDLASGQPQPCRRLMASPTSSSRQRPKRWRTTMASGRSPNIYNGRRKVFLDAIRGLNDVTVRGSEGGMYVMLDISAIEPDDEKFAWAFLDAEKVGVMPGVELRRLCSGPYPHQPLPAGRYAPRSRDAPAPLRLRLSQQGGLSSGRAALQGPRRHHRRRRFRLLGRLPFGEARLDRRGAARAQAAHLRHDLARGRD